MADYLMQRIVLDPGRGCWLWEGSSPDGYGHLTNPSGGSKRAHRASYETFVGPIPNGLMVCHKCDVKLCINPAHLYAGTAKNNFDDWVARLGGNLPKGRPAIPVCHRGHNLEKYRPSPGRKAFCIECQNERRALKRQAPQGSGVQCTACHERDAAVSGRCARCYDFYRIHGTERHAPGYCLACGAEITGKATKAFCSKRCRNASRYKVGPM